MRVWIMRHGESESNRFGVWTGQLDIALTEKGREQAVAAGRNLAGVSFDRIYSSDLSRARVTAETVIPGCRYECSELLREMDVGTLAGRSFSQLTAEERESLTSDGFGAFGGESMDGFAIRVREFMKKLESEDGENIAVFTHAGWMRRFFSLALGIECPSGRIVCGNCATAVFEYKHGEWRLHSWINLS